MVRVEDLAAALDACPDAFVAVDTTGAIALWTQAAQRLLGWSADEVVGRPDPSVPEESREATATAVRMLATGQDPDRSWQAPRTTRDGRRLTVQLTGWVPLDPPLAFGVFFREPGTVRARAHLRNRLSHDLAVAIRRADVVAVVDRALEGLAGAQGVMVLTECTCGAHLVTDPRGRCQPVEARGPWADRGDAGAEPRGLLAHAALRGDDGDQHVCLVPMGTAAAGAWLAVAGVHDRVGDRDLRVTLRAVADEAWVALQRSELVMGLQGRVDVLESIDASRSEAIAGVTHDLKAPIHVLQGFVQTLRSRPADSLDRDQALGAMDRQIARIARLVDDLLVSARAGQGPLRPVRPRVVDVGELVIGVHDGLDAESREQIQVQLDGDLTVVGDPDQLERVVTNLLDNARKYGRGAPIHVRAHAPDDVVLVVRDGGPGLAPDEHERVFERFETGVAGRDRGSTGLGLYVARAIAEGHGGRLRARPAAPHATGAVFELRLPAAGRDQADD